MDGELVRPHVMPKRLNSQDYLNFLRNVLNVLLPLAVRLNIWFLQDGAPPHYANVVCRWLNRYFPDRWKGRGGPCLVCTVALFKSVRLFFMGAYETINLCKPY